jgi:REP element-mobilizing transposase RayT
VHTITAFISWTCYGHWLHGEATGSVDPDHNVVATPFLPADPERWTQERERMTQPPYSMDAQRRRIVLTAIRDVCTHRGWILHAVHVRALHVHVIVSGAQTPERMMNDFKAYASRALNQTGLDTPDRKRWTRHGSTRYINDDVYLGTAINYVLNKQGTPMERWPDDPRDEPSHEDEPRPSGSE